jgi:hypothetical protein
VTAEEWVEQFAKEIGVEAPDEDEIERILDLAAEAAHSSERIAAPVACWIGARSGKPLRELLELARGLPATPPPA